MDLYLFTVIFFALLAFCTRKNVWGAAVFLFFAIYHFFLAVNMPILANTELFLKGFCLPINSVMNINRMVVFGVEAFIVLMVAIYNLNFMQREEELHYEEKQNFYHASIIGFVGAMDMAIFSDNIGMMWVFIELSTLLSALLISHHNSKHALEASWKYVFICSIGISLAFAGIVFLSIATNGVLDFSRMTIDESKLLAAKIAIPFLIVGFGTKVGLAPVHNWLPDAHSEAPAPISALLSATLLNSAFVAIVGIYDVLQSSKLASLNEFTADLLLIMGFLSLLIAAVFIQKADNFKRMLAYSSIENMGIIAIALALGKVCMDIHLIGHSLIKCALFLNAGNILSLYGTKELPKVRGLLKHHPVAGYIWLFGIMAILGGVPFVLFVSEFFIMCKLFTTNIVLAVLFAFLLTIIMFGMGGKMLYMLRGEPQVSEKFQAKKLGICAYLPSVILLAAAFVMTILVVRVFYGG